jgi:hypothetical protein
LSGRIAVDRDEFAERRDVGFRDAPVVGGGKDVTREVEFTEESAGAGGLVTGDPDEVSNVFEYL